MALAAAAAFHPLPTRQPHRPSRGTRRLPSLCSPTSPRLPLNWRTATVTAKVAIPGRMGPGRHRRDDRRRPPHRAGRNLPTTTECRRRRPRSLRRRLSRERGCHPREVVAVAREDDPSSHPAVCCKAGTTDPGIVTLPPRPQRHRNRRCNTLTLTSRTSSRSYIPFLFLHSSNRCCRNLGMTQTGWTGWWRCPLQRFCGLTRPTDGRTESEPPSPQSALPVGGGGGHALEGLEGSLARGRIDRVCRNTSPTLS